MRESELWARLTQRVGDAYVGVWAEQQAMRDLDGRTVREALADGVPVKTIWRAACRHLELSPTQW